MSGPAMEPLLRCKGLCKTFGGLRAVDGVDLTVYRGEVMGLIGPNGSGKTTIFNTISGIYRPTAGDITLHGVSLVGKKPDAIALLGIARTFQNIRLFKGMTVFQNVLVGRHCRMRYPVMHDAFDTRTRRKQEGESVAKVHEILEFLGLEPYSDFMARNLPYGLQRALEIARALASEPDLILLDEPAAGMNPQETEHLMRLITRIRDRGVTVFLVEHDMRVVMGLCDRIAVLNYGRKICEGTPAAVQGDEGVIQAYLGRKKADARAS